MAGQTGRQIDYAGKDYESFRRMMVGGLAEFMPEYTDMSQTDAGIVIIEQLARAMDVISMHQDVYANEAFFLTSRDRETAARWAAGLGYVPSNRTAAVHAQVFALHRAGDADTVIPAGALVKTQQTALEEEIPFETLRELVIPAGHRGDERCPADPSRYIYTVPARQGRTVSEERLGMGSGLPGQRLALGSRGAIVDTLRVFVNEGGGFARWERMRGFIDSAPHDRHYAVEVDEFDNTVVVFGDGHAGRPPGKGAAVFATYAVGGGRIGNVPPMSITVMGTPLAAVRATFNPYPDFTPGAERESLEEIKRNAPAHLRTLWRAVTLQDHADLALLHFPQLRFASAVQCPHDRNDALLYVLPKGGVAFEPGSPLHMDLLRFFDRRSMVGNGVHILPPGFRPLRLTADLHARADFARAEVEKSARAAAGHFFAAGSYPFDRDFVYSDFEAMLNDTVGGVRSFRITAADPADKIAPGPGEILTLESLELRVFGGLAE